MQLARSLQGLWRPWRSSNKLQSMRRDTSASEPQLEPIIPEVPTRENSNGCQHMSGHGSLSLPSTLNSFAEEAMGHMSKWSANLLDGAWQVIKDQNPHSSVLPKLSEFVIKGNKMTLASAGNESWCIAIGSKPNTICFADSFMELGVDGILWLQEASGQRTGFKRIFIPDPSVLLDMQGQWVCHDKSGNSVKRQLAIDGAFCHVASKHRTQHGILHLCKSNGTLVLQSSTIQLCPGDSLLQKTHSGRIWRYIRASKSPKQQLSTIGE